MELLLFLPVLGFFGLFKKSRKTNLTPSEEFPTQESLHFTKPLRELASQRIRAAGTFDEVPGVGFGPEFLQKAVNPVATQRMARLREETLPFLGSELSKRGVARSAGAGLATDVLGRAETGAQRDIDELMSKFFVLNATQRKQDIAQGLDLSTGLQEQQLGTLRDRASASERLAGATAQRAEGLNARDEARRGMAMRGIGSAISGISGLGSTSSFFGEGGGVNPAATASPNVKLLGSQSPQDLMEIYLSMQGGR